jgi:hypothetical protein
LLRVKCWIDIVTYQNNYKMTKKQIEIKPYQKLLRQVKFEKSKEEYTDREIQMEQLYLNKRLLEQLSYNQKNTETIKIILVVYAIISVCAGLLIGFKIV